MVSAHAFKRVESDPTLPLDEVPGSPVAKSPAGPAESNGHRHDEETAESIIHSSVRNVNLTFNIESSSSSTGEEGARNRTGDGGGGGFSFLGYLASCCFANPQDEPAESFGGRQNGHESGGWTPKAAHDDAKAKRMFSRNPSANEARARPGQHLQQDLQHQLDALHAAPPAGARRGEEDPRPRLGRDLGSLEL